MTTRTTGVIRVAVVDDQPLLVQRLQCSSWPAGQAWSVGRQQTPGRGEGLTARATRSPRRADLVLMDLRMPVLDRVSAIRELRAAPTCLVAVLVLTTFDDRDLVLASLECRAGGLLKDAGRRRL